MADQRENIIARFVTEGLDGYKRSVGEGAKATRDAGAQAEAASGGMSKMAKSLAVAAGGAAVAQRGFAFLKSATGDATGLARATAGLSRQTGMDARNASAWVSIAKSRGIESKALTTSFTAFSKQLNAGITGQKTASTTLKGLGVDLGGLRSGSIGTQQALGQVADAFAKMPDGAQKSALAVRLFGKQGLTMLPILNKGSGAIAEQQRAMQRAGLTMDQSGVARSLKLAQSQRELTAAMSGVKVSIGTALVPILVTLAQTIMPIAQGFADLIRKCPALGAVVAGLAIALGGLLVVAKVAAAFSALGIAVSASMLPVIAVIAVVAALAAGFYFLYTRVGWFRNAVQAVWSWIKSNWPLLLAIISGPIGFAIYMVVTNFGRIKGAVQAAYNAVVGAFGAMVAFIRGLPGRVAGVVGGMFNPIVNAAKNAATWAWRQFTWLVDRIREIPGKIGGIISDIGSSVRNVLPFATGGIVAAQTGLNANRGTTSIVGERGPELLQIPSGSRVTPLPPPSLLPSQIGGDAGGRPIVAQVFLDRKMIAEAFAGYSADQQAAR